MVEKLARDIEDADERARTMIEGQRAAGPVAPAADVTRVTEAIRDLDQRIARMGERPRRSARSLPRRSTISVRASPHCWPSGRRPVPARRRARRNHRRGLARAGSPYRRGQGAPHPAARGRIRPRIRPDRPHRAAAQRHRQPACRPRPRRAAIDPAAEAARSRQGQRPCRGHRRNFRASAHARRARRKRWPCAATRRRCRPPWRRCAATSPGSSEQVAALTRPGTQDQAASFDLVRRIEALSAEMPIDRSLLTAIRADLASLRGTVEQNAAAPVAGADRGAHRGDLDAAGRARPQDPRPHPP